MAPDNVVGLANLLYGSHGVAKGVFDELLVVQVADVDIVVGGLYEEYRTGGYSQLKVLFLIQEGQRAVLTSHLSACIFFNDDLTFARRLFLS